MTRTVLISGASIAGPALAYWLHHHGFRPIVVERAPSVRGSGYPIDVRGTAVDVVDRMGALAQLRAAHIDTRRATFVDARGRVIARMAPDQLTGGTSARHVELPRGDLARLLYELTRDDVEYVFNDSIAGIDEHADGVAVYLESGQERSIDLVVGADGLHSNVRDFVFGPEAEFRHDLGFYFAGFALDDDWHLDSEVVIHNEPGRMAGCYAIRGRAGFTGFLAFATPSPLRFDHTDLDQQHDLVASAFAGADWEVPRMLAAMRVADDFFFDSVSQIRMPRWTSGRVALVGDAAYAPALLSGQGTSIALVGAYVLAGELAAAGGDHRVAFPAYERVLRGFVERNQELARSGGSLLIPRTRAQLWLRNRLLALLPLLGPANRLFSSQVDRTAESIALPAYPVGSAAGKERRR